ncbi:MAG: hypothetical protein IJT44_13105 [Clostridia bacterium]|nr:hypothetical protein [Clostridia bacterium]
MMSVMTRSPFFQSFPTAFPQRVAISATMTAADATMMAVTMNSMVVLLSPVFWGFSVPRRRLYNTTTRLIFGRVVILNAFFVIFNDRQSIDRFDNYRFDVSP